MDRTEERKLLVAQLTGYLEELRDTGVEELYYVQELPQVPSPAAPAPPERQPAAVSAPPAAENAAVVAAPDALVAAAVSAPATARPAPAAAVSEPSAQPEPVAPTRHAASVPAQAPRHDAAPAPLCRGYGNQRASLLFILTGAGFEGEGGELLAKIIQAIGFKPEQVYLVCFDAAAPAGAKLRSSVLSAVKLVHPEIVVSMGESALQLLLQKAVPLSTVRGRFLNLGGIPLMPTLHPDQLVQDATLKKPVWEDMQQVMQRLKTRT